VNIIISFYRFYSDNGKTQTLSIDKVQEFLATSYEIGRKGLRVVGLAKGNTLQELTYMGMVGICDPPRPHVRECIQTLMGSGVEIKLVTGDAQETAVAIG
jgi:P-type Ca2+ transporter type 2C